MTAIPGLRVTSTLVPTDTADTYPVTDPDYQIGGWRAVATIAERNAIPAGRRRVGMQVYIVATGETWGLIGGIADVNWTNITVEVGGGPPDLTAYALLDGSRPFTGVVDAPDYVIQPTLLGPDTVERTLGAKSGEILSLADVGGVAGSSSDIRPFLDKLFLATIPHNKSIMYVNPGEYQLHTTFNPSDRSAGGTLLLGQLFRGGTLTGGQSYVGYNRGVGFAQYTAGPEITWYGAAGGTMIELDTIIGMAFEGIQFNGGSDTDADSANRCGIMFNVSQRGIQHGSGVHLYDRCGFADFDTCFRMGEGQVTDAGNCDTQEWRGCSWQNGNRGLHLTHVQNLVYVFSATTTVTSVKRFIHAEKGGFFNIETLNMRNCGGVGVDDWIIDIKGGSTVGSHRIGLARLEGTIGCRQFLRTNGTYCDVILEGFYESATDQDVTMFDLTGGQLTMLGGKLISRNPSAPTFMLRQEVGSGTATSLRLIGMTLQATEFTYNNWFGHATNTFPNITMEKCVLSNGRPIPAFSTRLENRLPVVLEGATSDGATTIALTLLRNGQFGRFDNCCTVQRGLHCIRAVVMAGVQSGGLMVSKQLRMERTFDIFNDGTIVVSNMQTVGVDHNPDALSVTLVVDSTRSHIRFDVIGKAVTPLLWRAEFTLANIWPHYSV